MKKLIYFKLLIDILNFKVLIKFSFCKYSVDKIVKTKQNLAGSSTEGMVSGKKKKIDCFFSKSFNRNR